MQPSHGWWHRERNMGALHEAVEAAPGTEAIDKQRHKSPSTRKNCDGSWTEWGSLVGVLPIAQGDAPALPQEQTRV